VAAVCETGKDCEEVAVESNADEAGEEGEEH